MTDSSDCTDWIDVEVAYARPDIQRIVALRVPFGTTAAAAIQASGILSEFAEIDLAKQSVGVFGKVSGLHRVLKSGDRVEIYRPLVFDPREARRTRAAQQRSKKSMR